MKRTYKADITAFIEVDKNMPYKCQQFKTQGNKTQILKDVKSVIEKFEDIGIGGGNICVTIREM